MPQPATHYLVVRRAIPREHWANWWDKYKPYFGLGSSAPDLFYFPKMPAKNIREDLSWEELANPMHSIRSYDMFCTLLSKAKCNMKNGASAPEKQFAFSFGYYCHVVTDCIFHPYVYRSTGDHWSSIDFSNELLHKQQEFFIDTGIFHKFYDKQNFLRIQWECKDADTVQLDRSIATLLHDALQEVYPDCYPISSDATSIDHPIQQAYSAMLQALPTLFEGVEIHLWGQRKVINTRSILSEKQDSFFVEPYPNCPSLDSYTPEELFNFASCACRQIFRAALSFWESDALSAREFLKSKSVHYIDAGNWNLDTGLPCQYNNYSMMRTEEPEHYSFKSDELRNIYNTLKAEYNPDEFS